MWPGQGQPALNGIGCPSGGAGYLLDIPLLTFVALNVAMGGAVLVAAVVLCQLFGRPGKAKATP